MALYPMQPWLQGMDIDNRRALYEHVSLAGGTSMFPGMQARLLRDLRHLYTAQTVRKVLSTVQAPRGVRFSSAWCAGFGRHGSEAQTQGGQPSAAAGPCLQRSCHIGIHHAQQHRLLDNCSCLAGGGLLEGRQAGTACHGRLKHEGCLPGHQICSTRVSHHQAG